MIMQEIRDARPSNAAIDAEFTPTRRRAILDEIMAARQGVVPLTRQRRRWPAAVGAAAASVAIVALAVQVLGVPGEQVAGPAESSPVPTGQSTAAPVEGPLAGVAERAALSQPIPPGKFSRVFTTNVQTGSLQSFNTVESYTDSDGWTWIQYAGEVDGWELKQPETYLVDLPADPAELMAEATSLAGTRDTYNIVFNQMGQILEAPAASGELRAAALLVLQRLVNEPQDPLETEQGEISSPEVMLTEVTANGEPAHRIMYTDVTLEPSYSEWIIVGEDGALLSTVSVDPESTSTSSIDEQSLVDELPREFVDTLGVEQKEQSFNE